MVGFSVMVTAEADKNSITIFFDLLCLSLLYAFRIDFIDQCISCLTGAEMGANSCRPTCSFDA